MAAARAHDALRFARRAKQKRRVKPKHVPRSHSSHARFASPCPTSGDAAGRRAAPMVESGSASIRTGAQLSVVTPFRSHAHCYGAILTTEFHSGVRFLVRRNCANFAARSGLKLPLRENLRLLSRSHPKEFARMFTAYNRPLIGSSRTRPYYFAFYSQLGAVRRDVAALDRRAGRESQHYETWSDCGFACHEADRLATTNSARRRRRDQRLLSTGFDARTLAAWPVPQRWKSSTRSGRRLNDLATKRANR